MNGVSRGYCEPISAQDGESPARTAQSFPCRISIIGASGSGKSVLARKLADKLDMPLHQLDHLRRGTGGRRLGDAAFAKVVAEVVQGDNWIVDGHYRCVRQMIWQRASLIIWLDYPLGFVMRRLIDRYRAKVVALKRNAPADAGQPEADSATWGSRIKRLGRAPWEKREYPALLGAAEDAGCRVIRLKDPAEADAFLDEISNASICGLQAPNNPAVCPNRMIEMLGVPGSGKSTVGHEVARHLQCINRRDIVTDWRSRSLAIRVWYIGRAFMDFPLVVAAIRFARCARLTPRDSMGRLLRIIAKHHWVRTRRGTLLLHQGYLQDIWSILAFNQVKAVDQACVTAFLTALYRGTDTTFIYLDVSPQTATSRILSRRNGNSRLDGMTPEQISTRLSERICAADLIFSAAVSGGLSAIRIDGHGEINEVADNTMKALQARGFQLGS